ncbi:MAG TPA: AraC family transcriptional regulator [Steroidobacteraceae bacterium]|nr:AraC family transcriptional regulator [Steroidobacteraceae bacterium]
MTPEAEIVGAGGAPAALRCWSTADVPPRDALAYWCDSIGQVMLELDIEAPGGDGFSAQLDQGTLGPVSANFLKASPQSVARTRRGISRSSSEAFLLVHLRSGTFAFDRAGETTFVHSGACILMDSRERYEVCCPKPTDCLILQLPAEWLRAWAPNPEVLAGKLLRPDGSWAGVLTAAVAALQAGELDRLALPPGVVAEQLACLLALAAGPDDPRPSRPDSLTIRLHRALRDRYHEVGLTPAAVAHDLAISVRYLHYLFAKRKTTFGRELVRVRLERARDLLSDPRSARTSIGDVAARCGFAEASHFARCFRGSFGVAPSDYRRRSHCGSSTTALS